MKKVLLIAVLVSLIGGCAVTSESYRYKTRFDDFYSLLNDQEKTYFNADQLTELGASLDARAASDPELSVNLREVKIHEAITTFDGFETARFFRYIILRELNRPNYYKLMNFLSNSEIEAFATGNGFETLFKQKIESDRKFEKFVASLKKEYRLYDFTDEQLIYFFRTVIFPDVTEKQVYYLFDMLKKMFLLDPFLKGETATAAQQLAAKLQGNGAATYKMAWNDIRKYSGLANTDIPTFLSIYYNVVMKEMDADALKETIMKF